MTAAYPPPPILYKFRGVEHLDRDIACLLERRQLYVPRARDLNDPFDCRPAFELPPVEEWERLIERDCGQMDPRLRSEYRSKCLRLARSRADHARFGDALYTHVMEQIRVLSLSAIVTHSMLWSHYASDGRGFAVGYRGDMNMLHLDLEAWPVVYCETRPRVPLFGHFGIDWHTVLRTKASHWKYEEEWRFMQPKGGKVEDLIEVPAGAVAEVVLGPRMSDETRRRIVAAAEHLPDRPILLHASLDPTQYKMTIDGIS